MKKLPEELVKSQKEIEAIAKDFGLDFFDTIFELVSYQQINQFAAYGGFPSRYPHWKWGMEYDQISKGYKYGLSKIYEMVINTNPCYAYLMEGNSLMIQKLVMAHVYGHCDFFKNNIWFSKTNRKMLDQMANHAVRIRKYMDKYGQEKVENFIDVCLSVENLINKLDPFENQNPEIITPDKNIGLLPYERSYMRDYINPPDFVESQKQKQLDKLSAQSKFPNEPQKDVLKFIINFAPLSDWQKDVLSIIREEALYMAPQGMTKTMNEGWASYWHSRIMTEKVLDSSQIIDFADSHSGVMNMPPNGYNPYKVGIELFRDIEERYNKGQFGKEWNECSDLKEKQNWNTKAGLGQSKIFEIRKFYNDVSFIDEFLTADFCVKHKMFIYKMNRETGKFEAHTSDFKAIKNKLLFYMTNFGQPIIKVEDANFENRGELLLTHHHEGNDLQPDYMYSTLKNLCRLWSRPVWIKTIMQDEPYLFGFDGYEIIKNKLK
jgi:stage V sporulation protein R